MACGSNTGMEAVAVPSMQCAIQYFQHFVLLSASRALGILAIDTVQLTCSSNKS